MIRRRFLALAFAAIVSMHVPQFGLFDGEVEQAEVEGTIEWGGMIGGIGMVDFDRPEGYDMLEMLWELGESDALTFRETRWAAHVPYPLTVKVPTQAPTGRVRYRWRRA